MKPVLEVDVKNVFMVFEERMINRSGVVILHLQRDRAAFGGAIPAPKDIPAAVSSAVWEGV
jgi:hypothetical protein